jgi:signal transduction histidine kinase/ActR/RegA family two-component response regulator
MTEFVRIVRYKTRGPASIMMQPVYPAERPWEMSGVILCAMAWDDVLETAFSNNVGGVHAVLESETKTHTYIIEGGKVASFQEGDIHQSEFDEYGVSTNLTWNDLHEMGAPMYKLSLYPTDDFVKSYSTSNPMNATVAALTIVLFISLLFLLYDYFVRREFLERHQLLEAKRRFIRFVSHEVRTPLNAVLMGLNIIEAEMEEGPQEESSERMQLLRDIQNNTESAVEVLNDVLLYDKMESALKLDMSMVPIWQVVERTLSEFKLPAARREVGLQATYETSTTDVECPYDSGLRVKSARNLPEDIRHLRVAGDASRLAQVLRNLLSNALKFTPEDGLIMATASYHAGVMGEERSRVKWGGSTSDWVEKIELHNGTEVMASPRGHFRLVIQDTGVGMTGEQISRLFGEGVQFNAHELQAGKGSGLGLFIVKGLVEQHRGTLEATSEGLNKGSKFTLKLPLYHVPGMVSQEDEQSLASKDAIKSDEPFLCDKGLHLLVVDDALSNRKLLCRLLERQGHKCDMAENGQVALEMVREKMLSNEEPYDSILMDYEMPVMNGPTASSLIRQLGCDAFIVGITGNVLSDDVQYFKSKGANAILPKPVRLSDLENLFVEYQIMY